MPSTSPPIACLLIHGLNGSPYDLADLAAYLAGSGVASESILLPGHGVDHRLAARFGWSDWAEAVRERFDRLAARYQHVALVGHSLGGALALHVAAHDRRVAGVATLCAPATLQLGLSPLVRAGRKLLPFVPLFREDISDRAERADYRRRKLSNWMAIAPVHSLLSALPALRAELGRIECPALVLASRHDHVVPARDGQYIFDTIGSTEKELVLLDRSWHVVTRDVERDTVARRVLGFISSLAGRLLTREGDAH